MEEMVLRGLENTLRVKKYNNNNKKRQKEKKGKEENNPNKDT